MKESIHNATQLLDSMENKNGTQILKSLQIFWKEQAVKQYWLEFFALATAMLLGLTLILGSLRQRTGRSFVRFILQATCYLSGHAISYIMGLFKDLPIQNGLVLIWAVFLLIFFGSVDYLSSGGLEDNEQRRKRFLWDYMLPSIWFLVLFFFIVPSSEVGLPLLLLWFLFTLKLRERKLGLIYACRTRGGLDQVTGVIVEFMKYEHKKSNPKEDNPTTLQGYKYLVGAKEAIDQAKRLPGSLFNNIVTIEKIWQCEGRLLSKSGDPDGYLKDTCLSFALFWLLLRRFTYGDELGELSTDESREKTWKFVRNGLLLEEEDGKECERAFKVVEVELDFLYDYLYNNYYATYSRGGTRYLLVRLLVVAAYLVVSFNTLTKIRVREQENHSLDGNLNTQIRVTQALIWVLIIVELAQIAITITSKWVKVKWICSYVQDSWWLTKRGMLKEKLLYVLCRAPCFRPWFKPWGRKLRQYSILDSFGYTPKILYLKWILEGYMDLPMKGQKESKCARPLSPDVKKAVVASLRTNGQTLSNGVASLRRNQVDGYLLWACDGNKKSSHVILVWHIATSICEFMPGVKDDANFLVATSLSKYCAYLVAFAPGLLPEHKHKTQCLFEQVVCEARKVLKDFKSQGSKYERLRSFVGEQRPDVPVMKEGALLGKQLMDKIEDAGKRWKVLADFWAELILFLAPSPDADEHARYLVTGGEFITHLWTLLTHAGIVHRDVHYNYASAL